MVGHNLNFPWGPAFCRKCMVGSAHGWCADAVLYPRLRVAGYGNQPVRLGGRLEAPHLVRREDLLEAGADAGVGELRLGHCLDRVGERGETEPSLDQPAKGC